MARIFLITILLSLIAKIYTLRTSHLFGSVSAIHQQGTNPSNSSSYGSNESYIGILFLIVFGSMTAFILYRYCRRRNAQYSDSRSNANETA